jgi:hypothetical protein
MLRHPIGNRIRLHDLIMFQYLSSYRAYILTKVGLSIAYLWFCWDFIRLNLALHQHLQELIPALASEIVCTDPDINKALIAMLSFLGHLHACWIYLYLSPVAVAIYLWGRHRWLQVGVAGWTWVSMIGMTARLSILMTTADFWLFWCFVLYIVAAFIAPSQQWQSSQPVLRRDLWRDDPTISSQCAFLLVVLQFTVYFYAGVNKLVFGWTPWISGVALQHLMYDPAMYSYVRGIAMPRAISFVLCYITLAQRLIVPFGFFSMRFRLWSVILLATMHLGYETLMQVAIFPLVGISCLLVILPPKELAPPVFSRKSQAPSKMARKQAKERQAYLDSIPTGVPRRGQQWLAMAVVALLLVEPAMMAADSSESPYWNIKLGTQLHWIMFADGGSASNERFKIRERVQIPTTGQTRLDDITDLPLTYFPWTWRSRLYAKAIFNKALQAQHPGSQYVATDNYLDNYVRTASNVYRTKSSQPQYMEGLFLPLSRTIRRLHRSR